jgi:hypothetical protein
MCNFHLMLVMWPDHFMKIHLTVRVRITLRLAVYRQSIHLGYKPLETHDQQLSFRLNTCFRSPYVTSSLTRGSVCSLQLPPVLASAVIHRSDFRGIRDHILLSQIRDSSILEGKVPLFISPQEQGVPVVPPDSGFLFLPLLLLAGLRWRYSTPPPQRINYILQK